MDKNSFSNKYNLKWVYTITIITFLLAIAFSVISENLVQRLNIIFAMLILLIIIVIGIVFDIIGISVTIADEGPYHAMATKRIEEANLAIKLVRNANQVSNFCNDVVGDISGIISGAVGASIIFKLINVYGFKNSALLNTLIASFTAALTVGGKALGKSFASVHYEKIVIEIAKFLNKIENLLNIELFKNNKKKKIKTKTKTKEH